MQKRKTLDWSFAPEAGERVMSGHRDDSDAGMLLDVGVFIDFAKGDGLVPVIVQEIGSNEVLMLAYMNYAAFAATVAMQQAWYFSRSKNRLWRKGEESGNIQKVQEIRIDCDNDTILLKVEQVGGAACHKGYKSCFFRALDSIDEWKVVEERVFDPAEVYKKKEGH